MDNTARDRLQIRSERAAGRHFVELGRGAAREAFLTLPALPGEAPAALLGRLYRWLDDSPDWRILRQDVFGVVGDAASHRSGKAHRLGGRDWPQTWVEQGNGEGSPVAGLQVQAVAGLPTKPVRVDGRTLGILHEDEWARYCVLGGLQSTRPDDPREAQSEQVLALMHQALAEAGMGFSNVIRTWFYLDDILEWYDGFNAVRNAFFEKHGIFDGLVPASTGIGGGNAAGGALVADLIAIEPKSPALSLRAVPSPLQCPALEYGSSFSRAVEIRTPGEQRLLVSGTASIAPEGHTIHVGNVDAQVATTMEVVGAILESCGLGWQDSVRAIGYFKHANDIGAFDRYCASAGLPALPIIITKNDVCRDDLLFELEVDAIRVTEI